MSDDHDPLEESAVALRAKATHCMRLAKFMGNETGARLMQMASDYIERAVMLEQPRKRDE